MFVSTEKYIDQANDCTNARQIRPEGRERVKKNCRRRVKSVMVFPVYKRGKKVGHALKRGRGKRVCILSV